MKIAPRALIMLAALSAFSTAQSASPPKKHLLVIGEEKGYRHESVSLAMATIERLGRETGLWDTALRTDTEVLTKKKLEYNAKNLNDFDAVLFFTGGNLEMDEQQKTDFLPFIHDDGKGFIGVHSAAITFVDWPEFVEMVGGTYDEHPWTTFDAPIVVEDPGFPGMQQFPHTFMLRDEIYQMKDYSRDKVRVLMRLHVSKLDLKNKNVHRTDGEDVRQRTRLLHDLRACGCELGQTGVSANDYRGHQMGDGVRKCRPDIASTTRKLEGREERSEGVH